MVRVFYKDVSPDGLNKSVFNPRCGGRHRFILPVAKNGRRRRPYLCVLGPWRLINPCLSVVNHNSRKAAAMGRRAARMAGNRPPIKPISADHTMPRTSSSGVTLKAKAIWLKLCQFIVEV